ncbi:aldo-keto reductase AKR2E4-like [Choristoneura fumiferana]|uniref:aldo-keto reductase AKR2E4-like n=1 Tax=Choristoneura fumiferana TaxID=7141 RepID=UPI003D15D6C0
MSTGRSAMLVVAVIIAALAPDTRSSGVAPLLKLNDGRSVPSFGLGTWLGFSSQGGRVEPTGHEVEDAVIWAIDAGYRHIDTAHIYDTETQVGRAIKKKISDGTVKREDLFVTTKLWNDKHAPEAVLPALRASLLKLDLEYVDLYLIHWPVAIFPNGSLDNSIDYVDTWRAMQEARAQGLTRSIGVSNFNEGMLRRLAASSPVVPAMLQVELNLNLQQPSLLAYCRQQNIKVTAYTPFGSLFPSKAAPHAPPPRVDDPALVAMATKYNKTVPQVALRYLLDLGVIPIPKSVTQSRVQQNIQLFDFSLTPEEKQTLQKFDRGYRTIDVLHWKDSPYYPFEKPV